MFKILALFHETREVGSTQNVLSMLCDCGHQEGGLNSKMAANRDVIEYPLAML